MVGIVENWSRENPEEIGKKYIIEIADIATAGYGGLEYRIKGTGCWLDREELKQFEEYKEREE